MRPAADRERGVADLGQPAALAARVSLFNERTQRGVIEDDTDGNGR